MNHELKNFICRCTLFFGSLALIIILMVKLWPASEIIIFEEDGVIEDLSAGVDAFAAILGFYAIYCGILRSKQTIERIAIVTLPVLALFCFLDEISWGARLFDLQMPAMPGGGEFDGIHDVFTILERLAATLSPSHLFIMLLAIFSMMVTLAYKKKTEIWRYLRFAIDNSLGRYLSSAICLLAFATILDFGHGRIISSLEEYSEFTAGCLMALAALNNMRMARSIPTTESTKAQYGF